MQLEIRTCTPGQLRTFVTTTEIAFGEQAAEEDLQNSPRILDPDRCTFAADDDSMVGTAGVFPFSMSIPGGDLPTAGVTMVGVLPTHRRKGILTTLMQHQLADIHQRGEPLAALWASEGTIYGRFGYGVASLQGGTDIERDRAGFRNDPGPQGETRLVSREDAAKLFDPIYEQVRRTTPGMYSRTQDFWAVHSLNDHPHMRGGAGPMFCAVHETGGRPDAYASYRISRDWDGSPAHRLIVREALAVDPQSMREIWRFLFGIDLIQRVQARSLPIDHPLYLMLKEPRRLRQTLGDALWVRIVDVENALRARTYATADRAVISIDDPVCPWNAGSWLLDTTGSSPALTKTNAAPEIYLNATDLASVYLGGFTFAQLVRAGCVERSEAVSRVDAMFHTDVAPYCSGTF